ncbi:molecular chaperone HtpG [Kordiimonas marina]|uniref:molecular chaperone HtpG n=1 Tax=Kordiimonas marina TaxID=2872312 RepID=UPI001FF423C4|nr:molecular chaperone HtpG [Kordiimonas marina]MCJ9430493.1 molecular chaperone HtpG [Kordiimonas marina]
MADVKTEKMGFEAEVSRLLHMMVHSVYSEREIFLRELISNASDACDKLRYEAQSNTALMEDGTDFGITITADKKAKTITVADNGIGMNRDDLISHLGTIARSGTAKFMDQLTGDSKKDMQLIGQFGIGFYSVFMVADKVVVTTKRAGESEAWAWESGGEGTYEISPAQKDGRGTEICLHLKDDADEYLDQFRLRKVVTTYSDHIAVPITLAAVGGDDKDKGAEEPQVVNEGSAIWTRPKSEITDDQYKEFYHHVGHAFDEPALTLHYKAEGMQEYTVLLFVPTQQPMDLFDPARKGKVKLYVKRVFITEDSEDLLPGWLRFVRGVVDSQDLPLNISREMLQNNPTLQRMSKAITKKVLAEFEKLADKDEEKFLALWGQFGAVLKEGLYEDFERREQLLKLARFRSTGTDGWTSLADYVARMKDKQSAIYYVTGPDEKSVARSPQLEGFKAKGIEVLLLSDAVDDFWLQMVTDFDGKPFKSITRGASDLKDIAGEDKDADKKDKATEGAMTTLITMMKQVLGDKIKDVRPSDRLTETAACLVADDSGMDMHLERILKAHNQIDAVTAKVLEINPSHALIRKLADKAGDKGAVDALSDDVWLILDQAKILEGDPLEDPAAFARRLSAAMEKGLV